ERLEQHVEPFLRLRAADRADDDLVAANAECGADRRFATAISAVGTVIDSIQYCSQPVRRGARPQQLTSDVARHSDRSRKARQDALVERIVDEPLAPRMSGPAVHRREG